MPDLSASDRSAPAARRKRISLELPTELVDRLDDLKGEWGIRSRGDILQRLLQQIFEIDESAGMEVEAGSAAALVPSTALGAAEPAGAPTSTPEVPGGGSAEVQEASALVLLENQDSQALDFALSYEEADPATTPRRTSSSTIDLPGFVRKNTDRLRQSLHPERHPAAATTTALALFTPAQVQEALAASQRHWLDLYGKPANAAVLEASMLWLARDVWPESDSSEGRPFTWSLAQQVVSTLAPSWQRGEASFDRVIVVAGILEDPFSGSTLVVRLPTLIRRFVQRVRQRRSGTSFNTLQETMTLVGALKLLNLPTTAGQRFTKDQIRDAFRQQALNHHPDSGGSADMMRRLNEAYQLLKDQYGSRAWPTRANLA